MKTRAISLATLRRKRSACTKSTAERNRDWRKVGPGVGHLDLQLVHLWLSVSSSKAAAGFGKQDQVERVIGPVRNCDFYRDHAQLLHRLQRGAVNIGRGILFHPGREVAHAQTLYLRVGIEVKIAGDTGQVARVRPGDGMQTSMVSSTLRVMGPSLSSDQQSVMAPVRGTRP